MLNTFYVLCVNFYYNHQIFFKLLNLTTVPIFKVLKEILLLNWFNRLLNVLRKFKRNLSFSWKFDFGLNLKLKNHKYDIIIYYIIMILLLMFSVCWLFYTKYYSNLQLLFYDSFMIQRGLTPQNWRMIDRLPNLT